MIIFLTIELGTTKENCGKCREMPNPFPIKSAVSCFFFLLNFVCDFFWLAEAFPYNLKKPQQIFNATATLQPKWTRELVLGGCSLSQKSYKVEGVGTLLLPPPPKFIQPARDRVFLHVYFLHLAKDFLLLPRDVAHSKAFCFRFILKHGKLWK